MKWLIVLLFSLAFSAQAQNPEEPQEPLDQNPQAQERPRGAPKGGPIAIPIAIGSMELAALAASTAASVGIISVSQNEEFQRDISATIHRLTVATAAAVQVAIDESVLLYERVTQTINVARECIRSRPQTCMGGADKCCKDFFSKFGVTRERGGFVARIGNRFRCCLEWDALHGGLEIFDNRGRHMGERGCDDLNEDPCEWTRTRGQHAQPASSTHRPRSRACMP